MGVRFISLAENVDSYRDPDSVSNILVPITNVMNDNYCFQTSKKIRQVFDYKRRNGQYIASYAPYDEHAMIYFCDDLPHPTREHDSFIEKGVERLVQILNISCGKALVLFTSKTDMEEVYAALQNRNLPFHILVQQSGSSQERVLQAFREDTNSVLLGTGAYWEGISIEGKSLSNLVIFRLPFPVPDPIIEYKASIAKDPLMDVRVPEMIIKLKQGIGRLIRNYTDTGIVSIIDSRLRDTHPERYHDITWNSLPIHRHTTDIKEAARFYHEVCG